MSIPPPRNTSSRTATQMYAPPMMTASQFNDLYSARTRAIIERSKQQQPVYTASGYNYYDQPATSAPYASYYNSNNSSQRGAAAAAPTTSAAYPSPVFPRSMPTPTTASAYGYMSRY